MADSDPTRADPAEDGLSWCRPGGVAAISPTWFHTLLSVMATPDPVRALGHHGFTVSVEDPGGCAERIEARHACGLRLLGNSQVLTAALCYWENYDPEFTADVSVHARQQLAFDNAYQAVQALGIAEFGPPTIQGRDSDDLQHRWSAWRIGAVLLAVHQAAGDVQFGVSIQLDARRYPVDAPFEPWSPFVDWMWSPLR